MRRIAGALDACDPTPPEHFCGKLDNVAVLRAYGGTMIRNVENEALELLRGCLDLAMVDMRPTVDLLARLAAHSPDEVQRLLAQLRRAGLLQSDRLGLTMDGLAVAAGLPTMEPTPMRARVPLALAA